jgi:hypothetical protein
VYNKNIYNVVLNNVINYINLKKVTIQEAIEYFLEQHSDTLNMQHAYISKDNSMFYDKGKIRVKDRELKKIMERVEYDLTNTP